MCDETPWNNEFSDFTLILDTGEKIRCHKVFLARASSVMKTMLTTDMVKARTNQMNLTGFDLESVTSFLQFIYSSGTRSVKVTDLGVDEARHFRKGQLNMPFICTECDFAN